MKATASLIITTISSPNEVLRNYSEKCLEKGIDFIIIGDRKSPAKFSLAGADFWSIDRQKSSEFKSATLIPENHYARKNLGYLCAIKKGQELILETDDDNLPYDSFWKTRAKHISGRLIKEKKWINIFRLFSEEKIWPRGFPLEHVKDRVDYEISREGIYACPIQQGLADDNPDVDALYRLTCKLPLKFRSNLTFILQKGSWCPFNSQNTVWFREAFPLLYLPSKCSFRMTDIWRSFVAQRIAWEYEWGIAFYSPTVYQERNEHNLMRDFQDEVPGYLNNRSIGLALETLRLSDNIDDIHDNMVRCYWKLIEMGLIGEEEMQILSAWKQDFTNLIETNS